MPEDRGTRKVAPVNSVDRAVSILQLLARLGASGVTEISVELEIHKSTVFRLLSTLEGRGLVGQSNNRGRYQLEHGIVQLAAGATRRHHLAVVSRPVIEELAAAVGETVDTALTDGLTVMTIDQVLGVQSVTSVNWIAQRTPMHATSAGKVFLAGLSQERVGEVVARGLERFTEHTITSARALAAVVEQVREQGWAFTSEEHELGYASVAAPIRDLTGEVVATVTVSGPVFRVSEAALATLVPQVLAAAAEISQRNGYPEPG